LPWCPRRREGARSKQDRASLQLFLIAGPTLHSTKISRHHACGGVWLIVHRFNIFEQLDELIIVLGDAQAASPRVGAMSTEFRSVGSRGKRSRIPATCSALLKVSSIFLLHHCASPLSRAGDRLCVSCYLYLDL
jgi:hypothetical protein